MALSAKQSEPIGNKGRVTNFVASHFPSHSIKSCVFFRTWVSLLAAFFMLYFLLGLLPNPEDGDMFL
jgi:hypothetical protein